MKIGALTIENNVFAAPMAGLSDIAYRLLAKEQGAGLVYSEMIHVMGTIRHCEKTLALMKTVPEEKPVAIQLFGKDPLMFGPAAIIAEEHGADIIDLNMCCPAAKVINGGSGCALMKTPKLAEEIIKETLSLAKVPVTVKLRLGWDSKSINIIEFAQMAEQCGVSAVTLHPRTRQQMFKGTSDWSMIKKLKESVKIPVIGSGDIKTPQDAKRMLDETGCDAIMLGRGVIGNPWFFKEVIHYLKTGEMLPRPSFEERVQMYLHHAKMLVEVKGERKAMLEMRKFGHRYVSGEPGASHLRQQINVVTKYSELESLFI